MSRRDEIEREHIQRCERLGDAAADRELYEALAAAEQRYDDLMKKLCGMMESTSPWGYWLKFYEENFLKLAPDPPKETLT